MKLKDFLASEPKIVVRTRKGEQVKGYLQAGRFLSGGVLHLRTVEGQDLAVEVKDLKGIFFVQDFEGDPSYLESKVLESDPHRRGIRARIRFEDNETMEGVVENSLELLQTQGFFFWPADSRANTQMIYVMKAALLGFSVLGVKG
ncbi:MAG: hypothetical protein ACE5JI_13145 [Acidobacteriota bacterium]